MLRQRIRTGIISSGILACLVLVGISLYADLPHLLNALAHFYWGYLPIILGCTLFNYLGRFIKWNYYLQKLSVKLPWQQSLLIFLSGLSMAITPGKIGEVLKSYLLKRSTGVSVSHTAPIIVAERLTDGIAMLGLATTGLVLYRFGWEILLLLLLLGIAGIALVQQRTLITSLLQAVERFPGGKKLAPHLRVFYESAYILLRWHPLLLAILIGLISWSGECLALYFVFRGLGLDANRALVIKSTFILAVSSLIGSASGLPGGLGTADGSVLGLTRLLITPSATIGGAATLLIRFSTLWFGLIIGTLALLKYRSTPPTEDLIEQGTNGEKRRVETNPNHASTPEAITYFNHHSAITSTGDKTT